jgi:uncharacterized protein
VHGFWHYGVDFTARLSQNAGMDRNAVIETLQRHRQELQKAGIAHLRLFGSVARNESRGGSDIDLAADFDRSTRRTLLTMARLENRLSDLLGVKVDLAATEMLREPVRARLLREGIHAF